VLFVEKPEDCFNALFGFAIHFCSPPTKRYYATNFKEKAVTAITKNHIAGRGLYRCPQERFAFLTKDRHKVPPKPIKRIKVTGRGPQSVKLAQPSNVPVTLADQSRIEFGSNPCEKQKNRGHYAEIHRQRMQALAAHDHHST
jgi:hypothetical protein